MKPQPAFLLLLVASAVHAAHLEPQKTPLSSAGLHVSVNVDAHVRDSVGADLRPKRVTVANIPFDLARGGGGDNLFLRNAGWPDWQKDPSSYYSDYDKGPAMPNDPRRPIFKIPVADYSAVYLLAATDTDRELSDIVSFRIGAMDGARRVTLHDFSAKIPRFDQEKVPGISTKLATPVGNVFLVRVPLGKAIAQDFQDEWALDVEVTKELNLAVRAPDPCRFNVRPIGVPSGVHIFGMTFMRSPVQMEVTSSESGHVFVEPQEGKFQITLRGVARVNGRLSLEAMATDWNGATRTVKTEDFTCGAGVTVRREVTLPCSRGWHSLRVRLLNGRTELLHRDTTFAMLPPDTRKHRDESPFGTWDFGGAHFTSADPDVLGPLYVKAGLRYGMFGYTAEARRKYGVLNGYEPKSAELLAKKIADDPLMPRNVLIFHEHAISAGHIIRTPDVFTDRAPYQLDATEQAKFDAMWKEAVDTAKIVRGQFPDARIAFGNGNAHLMEEFARRKFPRELFDSRGNEAGSFMRMPETQPLDFVANNASLWMDRQILDHYGYSDVPITQCYEICYPSTNPGNLSLRTQAAYYVRHMIHSLAWGVPVIRPSCISDVGNSYQFSNWGSCGLCFAKPELSPKPSYVAMSTLTRELDGAKFSRVVETGSPVVYLVEFRKKDGGFVSVAWTLRGERGIALHAKASGVDMMGSDLGAGDPGAARLRAASASGAAQRTEVLLSPDPIFISTRESIGQPELIGPPDYGTPPKPARGRQQIIASAGKLSDWEIESAPNTELEWFNFDCPRRKGDFAFSEVAEFEGVKGVLAVKPRPVGGSPHLPMYAVLALKKPIEIPGKPTEIAVMVNGNGGWGRVIFELEDAGGQRWTSIGAAMKGEATRWMADWMSEKELAAMKAVNVSDWNTNDVWQRSRINFEGWRQVRFPLPGQYDGEGYHWPGNCNWKHTGEGVVKYPLRFTKLIIELPEKVLHLNRQIPAPRAEIYLGNLEAGYEPIEKVSAAL